MIKQNSQFGEINLWAALEFGNGDILVTDGQGEDYVTVMFSNDKPHAIGETTEKWKGKTSDELQPQIAMFFNKVGSIDTVISKLMEARQNLIGLNHTTNE